jgi:hypothetical protein
MAVVIKLWRSRPFHHEVIRRWRGAIPKVCGMSRIFLNLAVGLAMLTGGLVPAGAVSAEGAGTPVVVELFTSQGCSSCPPADAFLGELARRSDVIALAFHIDYWDYIGWKDPFASSAWTDRQHAYKRSLGLHMVYTPQMVIDGRRDAVGSEPRAVNDAIAAAATTDDKVAVSITREAEGRYRVALPAAAKMQGLPATVWLVVFDRQQVTPVAKGENAGATLTDHNIVRELRPIGSWSGAVQELTLDLDMAGMAGKGCAVIVQSDSAGPILGAALMPNEM